MNKVLSLDLNVNIEIIII